MKIKRKNFFITSVIILSFLVVAIILNSISLEYTKNACIDNNKTPKIEQNFLTLNWSVSCE